MPAAAFALALCSAVLHAVWNLLLAREPDSQAATAVATVVGVAVLTPFAIATGELHAAALPYAALSGALEVVYFLLLAAAYDRGQLSVVYPVARGSAPLLVLAATVLVLGATVGAAAAGGVCLVAGGVVLVRGLGRHAERRAVGLALGVAACIASYTLVDRGGLRHASPLPYLELITLPSAVLLPLLVLRRRGWPALRRSANPSTVLAGILLVGAFALVLAALRRVPQGGVPAVEAVRESSVVVAVVLARIVLAEPVTRLRVLGACLVAAGVGVLAFA